MNDQISYAVCTQDTFVEVDHDKIRRWELPGDKNSMSTRGAPTSFYLCIRFALSQNFSDNVS